MDLLGERDKTLLKTIFDPANPLELGVNHVPLNHETAHFGDDEIAAINDDADAGEEKLPEDIVKLLTEGILHSEKKQFIEAFRCFDKAVKKAPESAHVRNDRAQALRLAERNEEALEELHLSVQLSNGKGKVGITALCQRGLLYRYFGQIEKARADFTLAAEGGSSFAKQQLAAINPYAKMCNAVLREITLSSMK